MAPAEEDVAAAVVIGLPESTNGTRSRPQWGPLQALEQNSATVHVPLVEATAHAQPLPSRDGDRMARRFPEPLTEGDLADTVSAVCSTPTVLVVEDDMDLARIISESLHDLGVPTSHAATGRKAIEACQREVPALVILDLILPEVDGFAVVEWMRSRPSLAGVPLVVFSAQEVSEADQERLRLGPTEYLTKSRVSIETFASRVTRLLNIVTPVESEGAA
jgi:CheY-like chemotaxis protein